MAQLLRDERQAAPGDCICLPFNHLVPQNGQELPGLGRSNLFEGHSRKWAGKSCDFYQPSWARWADAVERKGLAAPAFGFAEAAQEASAIVGKPGQAKMKRGLAGLALKGGMRQAPPRLMAGAGLDRLLQGRVLSVEKQVLSC